MPKYLIYSGIFNLDLDGVYECKDEDDAVEIAHENAVEDYYSYAGIHGISDMKSVAEELGYTMEEVEENDSILNEVEENLQEEIENQINYSVHEVLSEKDGLYYYKDSYGEDIIEVDLKAEGGRIMF